MPLIPLVKVSYLITYLKMNAQPSLIVTGILHFLTVVAADKDPGDYFSKFLTRNRMENGYENWVSLAFMHYKKSSEMNSLD